MIANRLKKLCAFLRCNPNKGLYLKTLLLSAFYRLCILTVPIKSLHKFMGTLNEESAQEESPEQCSKASRVAYVVNRLCEHTPWKSNCMVRALTAKHLLKKQKIPSTLYLGVSEKAGQMIAHAWLRIGSFYMTGGRGDGYTVVAKFRS